jgi:hypothetical protein
MEEFRARHQECAHAVSEIETGRPPGGIGYARRVISPLGVPGGVAEAANQLVAAPQVIEAEKNQPAMHVRLWQIVLRKSEALRLQTWTVE